MTHVVNIAQFMLISSLARATDSSNPVCIDGVGIGINRMTTPTILMQGFTTHLPVGLLYELSKLDKPVGLNHDYKSIEQRIVNYISAPILIEGRIGFDPGAVNNRHNRRAAERKNKKK